MRNILKQKPARNIWAAAIFLFQCILAGNLNADTAVERPPQVEKLELGDIRNLSTFGETVYLAGQPQREDFDILAKRGIKVVVSLRSSREMESLDFDEAEAAEESGIRYVHIPIDSGAPNRESVDRLLLLLANSREEPLMLHCGSANRVGYVWSIFRAVHDGVAVDPALSEGRKVGLRNPDLETFAREYIAWKQRGLGKE